MKKHYWLLGLALTVGFSACNKEDDAQGNGSELEHFYRTVSAIEVEVAYEPNAQPYTMFGGENVWTFTKANIEALFDGRAIDVAVAVPPNLAAMNPIPDQGKDSYTARQILTLADTYRQGETSENLGNLWVVFLDGYFHDGDSIRNNVIGVNIIGTTVTAVFKPVISGYGVVNSQRRFLEQTTIVHELGHALGLVNSGVPLTSSHQDTDHGAHCSNQDCVMYWLNAGAGLSSFIGGISQNTIVFGPECLQDTRSYTP